MLALFKVGGLTKNSFWTRVDEPGPELCFLGFGSPASLTTHFPRKPLVPPPVTLLVTPVAESLPETQSAVPSPREGHLPEGGGDPRYGCLTVTPGATSVVSLHPTPARRGHKACARRRHEGPQGGARRSQRHALASGQRERSIRINHGALAPTVRIGAIAHQRERNHGDDRHEDLSGEHPLV